jgi:hypothetical protein
MGPETVRIRPFHHSPSSWVVRWAGWPVVYTAGRTWRYELGGEVEEIPLARIERISVERFSWPLTILSFPLTLPPGIIDLVVHHAVFGFDEVNMRFDDFSSPRPGHVPLPSEGKWGEGRRGTVEDDGSQDG